MRIRCFLQTARSFESGRILAPPPKKSTFLLKYKQLLESKIQYINPAFHITICFK
ncbi:hypothetical protein NEIELOOT_02617 [Neisseria elongata subsp. glycolytica ATCC 29315]|uniref:Uncharacterized protein n=1 Tax=Neisseria elongata subsp. glycolytica ATCC 29315 TaxID=546263 RepID=D4DU60_NEIEG|nr:hypothetical protein NEIELOOT_02617 [Neisseria elongata subsp. glycolytica ATCC 29315]